MLAADDTDKDGKISLDEYTALMRAKYDAKARRAMVDVNQDGTVSRDELKVCTFVPSYRLVHGC